MLRERHFTQCQSRIGDFRTTILSSFRCHLMYNSRLQWLKDNFTAGRKTGFSLHRLVHLHRTALVTTSDYGKASEVESCVVLSKLMRR
jgi:hypothetical protein